MATTPVMSAYIDARFERLERALTTLTDSIHKYMPQPHHSLELAAADQALHESLQVLQTHQNNHARLNALHATSDALDAQIRDTLRLLWATRRDITSTTTTSSPAKGTTGSTYNVNSEELLNYARRISKTTLPAPGILAAAAAVAASANGVPPATEDPTSGPSTGVNTPITAAQTPAVANAQLNNNNSSNGTPAAAAAPTPAATATALPDEWARFLDPLTDTTFQPWPSEDKIRTGALAAVQALTEQGIDPRGFDPAEEMARRAREEQERRVQEEREAREREEQLRRAREERAAQLARERERAREEAMRRSSVAGDGSGGGGGGGPSPTVPPSGARQFQFMGDLEDDDED